MNRPAAAPHSVNTHLQAVRPESAAERSLFAAPSVTPTDDGGEGPVYTVMRRPETLKPHPSLLKLSLSPTNERLLALEKLGAAIFEQPLLITQEGLIVDGYARWRIALHRKRPTLLCLECRLTKQEALRRILQTHRRPEWLNAFIRVQLALEFEAEFQESARANQSAGGKQKASSKLTEDRRIDCRKEIATLAGVSVGNVTKVKQLIRSPRIRYLMEYLRLGEISIHRAWKLSKFSSANLEAALSGWKSNKRIRKLLAKQITKSDPKADILRCLRRVIREFEHTPWMSAHREKVNGLINAIEEGLSSSGKEANAGQSIAQENPRGPS